MIADVNVHEGVAVYVLINFLFATSSTVVQSLRLGIAAFPPQASGHDGMSAMAANTAAAHGGDRLC